jgi:hypothetical protein
MEKELQDTENVFSCVHNIHLSTFNNLNTAHRGYYLQYLEEYPDKC